MNLNYFWPEIASFKVIECPFSPTVAERVTARQERQATETIKVSRTENKFKCRVKGCLKYFKKEDMRQHVAGHILGHQLPEDENRCGFCGCIGCHIDLVKTSGYGAKTVLGPVSDCEYFVKLSLKWMKESTKNRPSSNHPTKCSLCDRVYWSYYMACHYKTKHA